MIKFLSKKRNQKGFTLVELIIVIAILGILMTLAIPRFRGFTNKAKVASDREYAQLIANSILILEAEEKITRSSSTGDIVVTIPKVKTGNITITGGTPADVTSLLEGLVAEKELKIAEVLKISIDGDDLIEIKGYDNEGANGDPIFTFPE